MGVRPFVSRERNGIAPPRDEIRPEKERGAALWDLHGIDLSFNESARDAFAGERKNGVAVDGTNDNKISILTNIRPPKNSQNSAERPTTVPQRCIYPGGPMINGLAQTSPPL